MNEPIDIRGHKGSIVVSTFPSDPLYKGDPRVLRIEEWEVEWSIDKRFLCLLADDDCFRWLSPPATSDILESEGRISDHWGCDPADYEGWVESHDYFDERCEITTPEGTPLIVKE